jgi:hypothetical protein
VTESVALPPARFAASSALIASAPAPWRANSVRLLVGAPDRWRRRTPRSPTFACDLLDFKNPERPPCSRARVCERRRFRLQSFGLAFGASADPGSSLIYSQLFWSQSFGEIVLANERSPCRCLLDPNKVMHLADHAAYLRGVLQINDAANSSLRNRFAAWVGRAANWLKRRPIQCPLRTFATETRCPRDFRFSPDSDHIEDAPTRLKSAKERTRFRGRGWRRGRAITSAAVTL